MCSQPSTNVSARRLGLVPVALHDVLAAHEQLADAALLVALAQREIDDRHREADRVGVIDGVLVRQERGQRRGLGQSESVADARARERVGDHAHGARCDRRAAVGDPADVAQVGLGEARMARQRVVDRRHRGQHLHVLLADRAQEAVEVERVAQDERAPAELRHHEQLAVAAGHVEQRHVDQRRQLRAFVTVELDAAQRVLDVRQEVRVRGHRALGKAGRAARVEDRREILGGEVLDREAIAVGQRLAGTEHVARAAVGDDVLDLGLLEARVDRHGDGARQLRAPEGQHPVDAVGQQDRDAIAALDADHAQPAGHALGALPQLLVGERLTADLDHGSGRSDRDRRSLAASARAMSEDRCIARFRRRRARRLSSRTDCRRGRPVRGVMCRSTTIGALSLR